MRELELYQLHKWRNIFFPSFLFIFWSLTINFAYVVKLITILSYDLLVMRAFPYLLLKTVWWYFLLVILCFHFFYSSTLFMEVWYREWLKLALFFSQMASQFITISFTEFSLLMWTVTHIPYWIHTCIWTYVWTLFSSIHFSFCCYNRTIFITVDLNITESSRYPQSFSLELRTWNFKATLAWVQILLLPLIMRPSTSYLNLSMLPSPHL